VRMAFLDEAGTSNPEQEPVLIVGGVIVNADRQWKAVQKRIEALWYEHTPPDVPNGYPFHAMELFHGGRVFDRQRFPREKRWEILDKLVAIPAEFNLAVIGGRATRAKYPDLISAYAWAFADAASDIEGYMRMLPDRDEVASIIVEDNPSLRSHVKTMQMMLQDERGMSGYHAHVRDALWLTRIMGEPHFEKKSALSLLQLADVCAFVLKRLCLGKPEIERFMAPLRPQTVTYHDPLTDRDRKERRV
jgi:hypothetical protein